MTTEMTTTGQGGALAESAGTAVAAQAKAAVEARYTMAIHRPRDLEQARTDILKDCKRPRFAAVARYRKPVDVRNNRYVEGPSIRFVEAMLRCMRNILIESPVTYEDEEQRVVRVAVTDLESNLTYHQDITVRKLVERKFLRKGQQAISERTNSYGDRVYLVHGSEDQIATKQAAAVSKAVRTLGLRLIPGDIVDEAMDRCVDTARQADAEDPDAAKRRLVDAFVAIGIQPTDLVGYLGHSLNQIQPAELDRLRSLYTAIRDGETTWTEATEADSASKRPDVSGAKTPAEMAKAAAPTPKAKPRTGPKQTEASQPEGEAGQMDLGDTP